MADQENIPEDGQTKVDLAEVALKIDASKLKAMREKLSEMSSEEVKARMERLKGMMSSMTPEQRAKMTALAKAKVKSADAAEMKTDAEDEKGYKDPNLLKPSDVVIGYGGENTTPIGAVSLDQEGTSIVPSSKVKVKMDAKELFAQLQGLEAGPQREQFFSKLPEEQKKKLKEYCIQRNPNMLLMTMTTQGNLKMIKELVGMGADINYSEARGDSVLMMACWFGKYEIVKFALESKADINKRNNCSQTALHYASMKGFIKIIKLLLQYGASLGDVDDKGYTPVICAAQFGHTALLDYYKRIDGDLFARDKEGHTILHWTSYNKHPLATQWLLNEGIDIHSKDSKGRTAIHWAAKQGNSSILQILVEFIDEEGFSSLLHEQDNEGKDPLDLAKYYENTRATRYIKEVIRRQKGCAAVWNRLTCQSGIRPGAQMRNTARMVSAWLLVVMALSLTHMWFIIRPYSPTIPSLCYPVLLIMGFLCYVFWFACNCIDPGYIQPQVGSSAHRKMKKSRRSRAPVPRQRNGYTATATANNTEVEMDLLDDEEDDDNGDVKVNMKDRTKDEYPEDAPAWTLPYDVLLERGRFDAICVTCAIVRPLRSKHCKHCNRCVSRFDHHCPWIDNCVAEKNRKQFVILCLLQTTSTWFYAVLCGIHLQHHSCSDALAFTLALPMMIHACLVATWGIALTQEHIRLAAGNITTNEKINQMRYSYMRDEHGNPRNPFDKGVQDNCLQFFGCQPTPHWDTLNINTKFLPPGKKMCCGADHKGGDVHSHSRGGGEHNAHDTEDIKEDVVEEGEQMDREQEEQGLLAARDSRDEELGAGLGL
uniref:Palmitoyltransferase n=1 Tax=Amorphochlora amoebiformis TaxID=1561963 RepID=A0A7S0DUY2_9EUKA|mmetsp:Transcript_784/g.1110  ORF Transcript_784/g.1110 Transcript_784/m.1110 type:complete len:822 (+) Transcript_784:46-2511(+)